MHRILNRIITDTKTKDDFPQLKKEKINKEQKTEKSELAKTQPLPTFKQFPKVSNRPESGISEIKSDRQGEIAARSIAQKIGQTAGPNQIEPMKSLGQADSNSQSMGVHVSGTDTTTGVASELGTVVRSGSSDATKGHEGLHRTFTELGSKYNIPKAHIQEFQKELVNELHPNDRAALSHHLKTQGYDSSHNSFNEEILAHTYESLVDKGTIAREMDSSHMQYNKHNDFNPKRVKQAWKNIIDKTNRINHDQFKNYAELESHMKKGWVKDTVATVGAGVILASGAHQLSKEPKQDGIKPKYEVTRELASVPEKPKSVGIKPSMFQQKNKERQSKNSEFSKKYLGINPQKM